MMAHNSGVSGDALSPDQVSSKWPIQVSLAAAETVPFWGSTGGAALSEGGASVFSTPWSRALTLVPPPL